MLKQFPTLEETRDAFRWNIPEFYNIGVDICDRPAQSSPDAPALIDVNEDGDATTYSFADLQTMSNRLANLLSSHVKAGDRVGVLLPQCIETALAHIAVTKLGAISLPLFTLFGPDALAHRLGDSGANTLITNAEGSARVAELRALLPKLKHVYSLDGPEEGVHGFHDRLYKCSDQFQAARTRADDPAILIYTSGTTGAPKGALHAHRVLLGHLPGVEMSHDFFPQPDDKIWTPADWAWIGGLLDVLMPALHHGVPVVACRFRKFTGKAAFELMRSQGVRNAFLPPTALKMMRLDANAEPLALRSVASGGETLGPSLITWGEQMLGTTINEFYGQTECNMIVSSCGTLAPAQPGIMGFPVPGHDVAVINADDGQTLSIGEIGDIAVRAPDPVMFLRYWNAPEATAAKFLDGPAGRWLLTGDKGQVQDNGRLKYIGRDDDVINSGGYRIGPGEVEDCLIGHPAVHMAGVVGRPDEMRGQTVVAFVTLVAGVDPTDALATEISEYVKSKLAAHEYPRDVSFVAELPMTTTGKIIRATLRDWAAGP